MEDGKKFEECSDGLHRLHCMVRGHGHSCTICSRVHQFQLTSWKRRDGLEAALCQSSDHLESTKLSMQSANNFPWVVANSLCAFFHQFFSAYYFILSNTPNTKCPLSNLKAQRSHRERRRPPRGPAALAALFFYIFYFILHQLHNCTIFGQEASH